MDSPLDAFPSEDSPGVPAPVKDCPEAKRTRTDRLWVVATAACTSAGVTVLTMWLWGRGQPPAITPLVAEAGAHEVVDAPEPQVARAVRETLVDEGAPALVAAPHDIPLPAQNTSLSTSASSGTPYPLRLLVLTEPDGARVTINGVGWGTTPLTIRNLPPGTKRIRVTRSGYQSEERIVSLVANRAAPTVHISLRGASGVRATQ